MIAQQIDLLKLEEVNNLPTLPVVVQHIRKLTASPLSNMSQIAQVIARDQAIATRVIRLVNSAFYGLQRRVTSIHQAIVLLGLNTVKNLVIGVSVVKTFESDYRVSLFDRGRFWTHTMACALAAKHMAVRLHREEPEDYFLAGLLHDIGILVLDQFFHDEFLEVLRHTVETRKSFPVAEQDVLGTTHAGVGRFLAGQWKLPDVLAESISYHHLPASCNGNHCEGVKDAVAIVHLADILAFRKGFHFGMGNGDPRPDAAALRRTGVSSSALEEIGSCVEKEIGDVMREWGL